MQPSQPRVQVQGCNPTIVHYEMSSFSSVEEKKKKKITTYRSQSRGLVRARTADNSIFPVAPFITCYRLAFPPFANLFHADEINSTWRYLSFVVECSSRTARLIRADKSHGARPERRGDLSRLNVFISVYLLFEISLNFSQHSITRYFNRIAFHDTLKRHMKKCRLF